MINIFVFTNYSPGLKIFLQIRFFLYFILFLSSIAGSFLQAQEILLEENFINLKPGMFSSGVVGAHAEYHYIPQTAPQGNWVVSCFRSNGSQRAWRVIQDSNQTIMYQSYTSTKNEIKYTHPILIAGDELWQNYSLFTRFIPESKSAQSGILFRYQNDRCYYFFGVNGNKALLKSVNHAESYRTANEQILGESQFTWESGEELIAKITLNGDKIRAEFENGPIINVTDKTFSNGKIGLMSDIPTRYLQIKVSTDKNNFLKFVTAKKQQEEELKRLQSTNPKMVLWKKFTTEGFGVGRNLRFGDLNNDGQIDVLIGQVIHHGPKDRNSELSCLTAITFDGEELWQIGIPDSWKDNLTNDVGFQIHDINQDGKNEVIYCMNTEIVVAEGATGKTIYKSFTPENKSDPPHDLFPRILGDCLFFCDIRGLGYDGDILIKDRYQYFWVLNDKLELLWEGNCKTGHYPFAEDIDSDGKDEIAIGYSLYDQNGDIIFCLDNKIKDHADGVAIVKFNPKKGNRYTIMNAASDEGMLYYDPEGTILKHHHLGHVQNPSVANFRDDLPGLETVSINFWGNQGIIHFFDSNGEIYYDFEPVQHGSMMLPINWTGKSEEFFVLSASVSEGGLFDGWGRKVVDFPADGHPELCNAVLDITGDCRDEIVVWDAGEIWVYTQDNNPIAGRLYKPHRNPLYNYSNYQATVSLPGW